METHRQRCQGCGCLNLRNILVREPGLPTVVYACCADCRQLVARYRLSSYYHHGKGVESYLRSHGSAAGESGREVIDEFEAVQRESLEGFDNAIQRLAEEGKEL